MMAMDLLAITLFDVTIPLWLFFLIFIVATLILWKLIKFAIKLLIAAVVFFIILFGLDILGVFDIIQGLIAGFS